jgi:general secretion pathway protein J
MQVATWVNNMWRQGGVDPGANTAGSAQGTPPPQLPPDQAAQTNNDPTGLQVALQAPSLPAPLVKSFLLGEP